MTGELPQGWITTTLGQVCSKPQYGWTSKASRTGTVRYVRTTDISNGSIKWSTVPFCEEEPDNIKKYRLFPDDILVSRAGSVGVSYRISDVPEDAIFASYLIRFNVLPGVEPRFVELFLKSDQYWRSISDFTAGIAIPNVNASKLASLDIPLAPVHEQERIVAKAEKLLSRVDECQRRLSKIPIFLKRLHQSVLAAALSGRLTADWRKKNGCNDDWRELRLAELLASPLSNGRSVPDAKKGFPVLRLTSLKDGRIDLSERKIGAWTEEVAKRFLVREGDFLVSRGNGSLALVGRGGLVGNKPDAVAFPDTLIRIRVRQDMISLGFLRTVWNSQVIRDQIEAAAHTTAGIWKISQSDLENFVLPMPSVTEQNEIVRRVENLFALADKINGRYQEVQQGVDHLSQSILAKAFRGELVQTEVELAQAESRAFESAEKLLERIEHSNGTGTEKKRIHSSHHTKRAVV